MSAFLKDDRLRSVRERMGRKLSELDIFNVGSMFSGWGVLEMVLEALQREWNCFHNGQENLHFTAH